MNIDLSGFTLNEIITVNKEYLEEMIFKLHINNKDYIIFIPRVGVALIDIEVYNEKHQVDMEYPIEYELIRFNAQWEVLVDFFNPETYYHDLYLGDFLENYEFELLTIDDERADILRVFHENEKLLMLISNSIMYKNLRIPTNIFEEKFKEFILNICINRIRDNNYLIKKLINIKENNEKEKEQLKKYMENKDKELKLMHAKYGNISNAHERRTFQAEKFLK